VPGIQEIFILVIVFLAIVLVPRMVGRRQESVPVKAPTVVLSGKMRLALAASILWPAVMAAVFKPWRRDFIIFCYIGLGPVALAWILFWVRAGFRRP